MKLLCDIEIFILTICVIYVTWYDKCFSDKKYVKTFSVLKM